MIKGPAFSQNSKTLTLIHGFQKPLPGSLWPPRGLASKLPPLPSLNAFSPRSLRKTFRHVFFPLPSSESWKPLDASLRSENKGYG